MLAVVLSALIAGCVVWFGISIYERIQEQRKKALEESERLAEQLKAREAEREYVRKEAEKFAAALHDKPITKRTIESPRVVHSNVLHVSEKKIIRDSYPPVYQADTYCEPDCVPLVTVRDAIAIEASMALADTLIHRDEQTFVPQGGSFDGGGASDTYEEERKETYSAPEPEPSYSESDSSSSGSSDEY